MAEHERLLHRFRPVLVYDSQEAYFADHPAQMVVNPGNELRRADGTVLARTDDNTLRLDVLDEHGRADDRLAICGKDYRTQYVALREAHPDLKNHMVAHAQRDSRGDLWLQYWLWYFYNDYRLAANVGLHEGDWEMVQLRLDGDDPAAAQPDYAVYAQHRQAERRPWDQVHKDPDNPDAALVFVARGSHASYFRTGLFETEVWADICDGARRSPPSTLLLADDAADHPWVRWPGRWGDTEGRNKAEDPSPDGPGHHAQWTDPHGLFADAADTRDHKDPIPGADFAVERQGEHLRIHYDLRRAPKPVATILANVNSRDEPGTPPRTFTFDVRGRPATGTLMVSEATVSPERTYDVRLSVVFTDDEPSAVVSRSLDPGRHAPARVITTKIAAVVVPAVEWLRKLLRRRR
ncbi:MAG: hypothetical protein JWR63_3762 [Conexibacter sp.]|nr:hypothetical protein [Conexibacter sp.]